MDKIPRSERIHSTSRPSSPLKPPMAPSVSFRSSSANSPMTTCRTSDNHRSCTSSRRKAVVWAGSDRPRGSPASTLPMQCQRVLPVKTRMAGYLKQPQVTPGHHASAGSQGGWPVCSERGSTGQIQLSSQRKPGPENSNIDAAPEPGDTFFAHRRLCPQAVASPPSDHVLFSGDATGAPVPYPTGDSTSPTDRWRCRVPLTVTTGQPTSSPCRVVFYVLLAAIGFHMLQ